MNATAEPTTVDERPADRPSTRRYVVLRHRLRTDGVGLPFLAAGLFVATMAVTGIVSLRFDVRISGWELATQITRWFVGAMGVYLSAVYLPLYVTHGLTRRAVARDGAVFGPIYALLAAVAVAAGFALEGLVYRVAGWQQGLDALHLFDASGQLHLIVVEYGSVFLVWFAAGALLGAGFYRDVLLGFVLIPPGLGAAMLMEAGIGPGNFGPLPAPLLAWAGFHLDGFGPLAALVTAIGLAAVLAALTWLVVRDVPIRNQAA